MNKLLIWLFCFLSCFANAQNNNVRITIKYLENNQALAKSVGNTLSNLFTEFYSAYENANEPNLRNLYISGDTKTKILALWKRHKFRLAGMSCALGAAKFYKRDEYAVFSVPMQVMGERNIVEYTIHFNSNGIIINFERVAFPLMNFNTGKRKVDEQTKGTIKVMLYQLRNAYNTKDSLYLRKIYDPKGYCIVGTKTVNQSVSNPGNEWRIYLEKSYFNLTIKKLSEYLDDLNNNVFKKNAWLNINFGVPEITAHQNSDTKYDDIYYINVFQDYKSQTYSDQGWLTLVLNLRDKSKPLILARIWLPEKITPEQLSNLF